MARFIETHKFEDQIIEILRRKLENEGLVSDRRDGQSGSFPVVSVTYSTKGGVTFAATDRNKIRNFLQLLGVAESETGTEDERREADNNARTYLALLRAVL